jgi:hypothetical protein
MIRTVQLTNARQALLLALGLALGLALASATVRLGGSWEAGAAGLGLALAALVGLAQTCSA